MKFFPAAKSYRKKMEDTNQAFIPDGVAAPSVKKESYRINNADLIVQRVRYYSFSKPESGSLTIDRRKKKESPMRNIRPYSYRRSIRRAAPSAQYNAYSLLLVHIRVDLTAKTGKPEKIIDIAYRVFFE